MSTPVLKTKNSVIRAFERKDLEIFTQYRSQEMVVKYQSWINYTYQEAIEIGFTISPQHHGSRKIRVFAEKAISFNTYYLKLLGGGTTA